MSKVYVFRGSKEISKEQVLEQLGLGVAGRRNPGPGGGAYSMGVQNGFLESCVSRFLYSLNSLLDELQTDQWLVPSGNRLSRRTGVALSVAAGMVGAFLLGTGA